MLRKISKISGSLKDRGFVNPVAGIIPGTGPGGLSARIENRMTTIIAVLISTL